MAGIDNDKLAELNAKIQALDKEIQERAGTTDWEAEDVTQIFIRPEGSTILLRFTKTVIGKVKGAQRPKKTFLPRFYCAVEEVHKHITKTLKQHRMLQFFMEEEIRNELSKLHTGLAQSCNLVLTKNSEDQLKEAKEAEAKDSMVIKELVNGIGDVTLIAENLGCDNTPPKDALKEVGEKSAVTASLLQDYKKCIERDWFFLTFKSELSRQQIKAPLTRVVNEIIPKLEALSDDDKIALSSNELHGFEMVNRLFAILDNSKDPALKLVKSLQYAVASTNGEISNSIKEGKFVDFASKI